MAVLSRKTCSLTIELLEHLTTTKIEQLFYEAEVPNNFVTGNNKTGLLLNVFRLLERHDRERLLLVVQTALKRISVDDQKRLKAALLRDGFVGSDDGVVSEENLALEHKTALVQLVEKQAQNLTAMTLLHHLHEAEELFCLEKWDASIGQARNFVELLLTDIARHIANQNQETPDLSKPFKIREYLQKAGFFDEGERKKLVDGVYGFFSEQGSHPGIGEQSTARVCLSILWNFGFYVLEKFEAWAPSP